MYWQAATLIAVSSHLRLAIIHYAGRAFILSRNNHDTYPQRRVLSLIVVGRSVAASRDYPLHLASDFIQPLYEHNSRLDRVSD